MQQRHSVHLFSQLTNLFAQTRINLNQPFSPLNIHLLRLVTRSDTHSWSSSWPGTTWKYESIGNAALSNHRMLISRRVFRMKFPICTVLVALITLRKLYFIDCCYFSGSDILTIDWRRWIYFFSEYFLFFSSFNSFLLWRFWYLPMWPSYITFWQCIRCSIQ